jgi:hypothetical protein
MRLRRLHRYLLSRQCLRARKRAPLPDFIQLLRRRCSDAITHATDKAMLELLK